MRCLHLATSWSIKTGTTQSARGARVARTSFSPAAGEVPAPLASHAQHTLAKQLGLFTPPRFLSYSPSTYV